MITSPNGLRQITEFLGSLLHDQILWQVSIAKCLFDRVYLEFFEFVEINLPRLPNFHTRKAFGTWNLLRKFGVKTGLAIHSQVFSSGIASFIIGRDYIFVFCTVQVFPQWRSQPDNLVLLFKFQIIIIIHFLWNWLFSQSMTPKNLHSETKSLGYCLFRQLSSLAYATSFFQFLLFSHLLVSPSTPDYFTSQHYKIMFDQAPGSWLQCQLGGAHIYIFVFCSINLFWNLEYINMHPPPPPQLVFWLRPWIWPLLHMYDHISLVRTLQGNTFP